MIRFIILAGGSFAQTMSSPVHPLQSLGGHNPMICVLLTTLFSLQLDKEITMHLLVRKDQEEPFEKTIRMWFPHQSVEIFGSLFTSSSDALRDFFSQVTPPWEDNTRCVVLPSFHVLFSRLTMEQFVAYASCRDFVVAGIKKSKWNQDRHLYNMVVAQDSCQKVQNIEENSFQEIGWIPLLWGKKKLWEEYLPQTQRVREIVNSLPENKKPCLYLLHSFPLETDSLCIQTEEDKVLASHKFLEKHHADYLNQCYFIWSECKKLEERLSTLEKIIQRLET